jgi:hypothetical protein
MICLKQEFSPHAGFLTLIPVLASVDTDIFSEPALTITTEDEPDSEFSCRRRMSSISFSSYSQLGHSDLQEEHNAPATLVFK